MLFRSDLHGMIGAAGVITEEGGSTSHAAVVSRALGVPCVVGCGSGTLVPLAGQTVTVDGQSGSVYAGELAVHCADERNDQVLNELLAWATERSPLRVLRPSESDASSTLDLSTDDQACDEATIEAALGRLLKDRVVQGARGGAIATDSGVRAALRHGLQFIVAEPTLPALLAAVHASRDAVTRPPGIAG